MNIAKTAEKYNDYVIECRRRFHENPEISGKEYMTSKFIREELDKIGVPYVMCGLETGFIATIQGGKPGKTILLRGDMDALTVTEENDLDYKSKNDGIMHACGHDAHAAMLLTAAHILNNIKDELAGTIKLAFQPAEEIAEGADSMIANGAMEGVDGVFAIHVWSPVPTGKAVCAAGPRMASAAQFEIWVQGKGGHGAEPHACIDAATCSAAIVSSLQTIVSREFRPIDAAVCTVGRIDVGSRWNAVADKGYIAGTTRCYSASIYDEFPGKIERIAKLTGEAYRCEVTCKYTNLVKPTVNHPVMAELCESAAKKIFGEDGLCPFDPSTVGEDFSSFIMAAPEQMGALAFVGIGSEEACSTAPHHSPKFRIDERALIKGAALYCQVAADFLAE